MKPIELKIEGLHSYRQEETIDFAELGRDGLFGVFGPTGAGKSTLLDAVTLALFGKIRRAMRGTQGVLNQQSDEAAVSFTFLLGIGEGRNTYKVERRYRRNKRAGEFTVQVKTARLIRLGTETETATVLADKPDEVTERIIEILGLDETDFMRAVVLPQGQFADFLQLTGVERRNCLQRLFGLEEYGEKLQKRVKAERQKVENQAAGFHGELAGLGEASDEALKQAQDALLEAEERESRLRATFAETQAALAAVRETARLSAKLAEAERETERLESQKHETDSIRRRLEAAERAESLAADLTEAERAAKSRAEAEALLETTISELEQAVEARERFKARLEAARGERDGERPMLDERRIRLTDTIQTEAEMRALQSELADLITKQSEFNRRFSELDARRKELETERAEKTEQKARRTDELERVHVRNEEREHLQSLKERLERLERAEKDLESAKTEHAQREVTLDEARSRAGKEVQAVRDAEASVRKAEDELAALENTPMPEETELSEQAARVTELAALLDMFAKVEKSLREERAEFREASGQVDAALAKANELRREVADKSLELEATQDRLKVAEHHLNLCQREDAAAYLAATLAEGKPCPVCGSEAHPVPAASSGSKRLENARNELESAKAAAVQAERELRESETALVRAEGESVKHVEIRDKIKLRGEKVRTEHDDLFNRFPEDWRPLAEPDRKNRLHALRTDLSSAQKARADREKALPRLRKTLEATQKTLQSALERRASAIEQERSAQAEVERTAAAVSENKRTVETLSTELDDARGTLGRDDIRPALNDLEGRARRADQLRNELKALEPSLSELDSGLRAVEQEISEVENRRTSLSTERTAKERELSGIQEKVSTVTGGLRVEKALDAVNDRINQLEGALAQAETDFETARQTAEVDDREVAKAGKSLENAKQECLRADERLLIALSRCGFADSREATEARIDTTTRESLRKHVETFDELLGRNTAERDRLRAELGDRTPAQESLENAESVARAAEIAHRDTVAAVGAARKTVETVKERNERWAVLAKETAVADRRLGLLKTLTSLLEGNRFVEFIAEERLHEMALFASDRLKTLTRGRYALEVDSEGNFVMRDDFSGGGRRPVSTLSGGETFLTSLALALALSTQIQSRGSRPLEFFFLDEGFGTLDPECLDLAFGSLETLRSQNLTVGLISHVRELRNRLPRCLIVHPSDTSGKGTTVRIEST